MYFIADYEKKKEEWINSIGRSIVHLLFHLARRESKRMNEKRGK
jgi:hypothetical protein